MFDSLPVLPPDSILGLAAACRADPNPDKVDLTLGVYMDETGLCPVFEAVQQAQQALVSEEQTKVYMPPQGDPDYLAGIRLLVLGEKGWPVWVIELGCADPRRLRSSEARCRGTSCGRAERNSLGE